MTEHPSDLPLLIGSRAPQNYLKLHPHGLLISSKRSPRPKLAQVDKVLMPWLSIFKWMPANPQQTLTPVTSFKNKEGRYTNIPLTRTVVALAQLLTRESNHTALNPQLVAISPTTLGEVLYEQAKKLSRIHFVDKDTYNCRLSNLVYGAKHETLTFTEPGFNPPPERTLGEAQELDETTRIALREAEALEHQKATELHAHEAEPPSVEDILNIAQGGGEEKEGGKGSHQEA